MEFSTKKTTAEREAGILMRLVRGALKKENIRKIYGDINSPKFEEMVAILANQFNISSEISDLTIARVRLETIN
jgi:hypothetical protein